MSQYDYDWMVIGSGFGGSVSALRLAEKGYKVGVVECGKRFTDKDFPKSTWDIRRYFWAPRIGPIVIKERVRAIGGQLSIDSMSGRGARLEVLVPQKVRRRSG